MVVYRWDTNLVGQIIVLTYLPQGIVARYAQYSPSLIEIISGAGVLAYVLLAYTIGVRYLDVVDHRAHDIIHKNSSVTDVPRLVSQPEGD